MSHMLNPGMIDLIAKLFFLTCALTLPAWIISIRRKYFSFWDVPLSVFVVVLWMALVEVFKTHDKTMSNLIEPIIGCVFSAIFMYLKPFVFNRFSKSKHQATLMIYVTCVAITIALVFLTPPLQE